MTVRPSLVVAVTLLAFAFLLASCASKKSSPSPAGGARELDSGDIAVSASWPHRFFAAGDYTYHCRYHGAMTGTVTVDAGAADSVATVTIVSSVAPFPAASIRPGGKVTWVNNTAMVHTVTSN